MTSTHEAQYRDSSTFQSLNSPRFKLLECNFSRGWADVEIQSVVIGLLLELCTRKLSLLVVQISASLMIDSGIVVADHDAEFRMLRPLQRFGDASPLLKWQTRPEVAQRVSRRASRFRHTRLSTLQLHNDVFNATATRSFLLVQTCL